jgi:hypothetical protein
MILDPQVDLRLQKLQTLGVDEVNTRVSDYGANYSDTA